MATTKINSIFKVQPETVATLTDVFPEKGALIYDDSVPGLFMGDGFNWLQLGGDPSTFPDTAALQLRTPFQENLTGDVELTDVPFFDTLIYEFGTTITPTIPDTITITKDMFVDITVDLTVLTSTRSGVELLFLLYINGVEAATRIIETPVQSFPYQVAFLDSAEVKNLDVITFGIKADQTCGIDVLDFNFGIKEVQ